MKPENVLIGADGNLCLTDFGLSKESVQDNELVHTFVGTTEYLAPEILRQRGYSKAVDWWSLGVLLCVTHLKHCSCPVLTFYFQIRDGRRLAPVLFQKQAAHISPYSVRRNQFPRRNGRALRALDTSAANQGAQEALGQVFVFFPCCTCRCLRMCSPLVCSGSHGAANVRAHPFFESIDWAALMTKTLPPPFVPQTSSLPLNFDERYMKRTPVDRCQLARLSFFVSSHCTLCFFTLHCFLTLHSPIEAAQFPASQSSSSAFENFTYM